MGVLEVGPSQVTFADTCPAPQGEDLHVTPPTGTVTITNTARAEISNLSVKVDEAFNGVFVATALTLPDGTAGDPTQVPTALPGLSSMTITYEFLPKEPGTATATLTVSGDNAGDTSPAKVRLTGQARDLPAAPKMALSCPPGDVGLFPKDNCALWPDNDAQLYYKETPFQTEAVWDIAITNGGCPDLVLSEIQIKPQDDSPGTETAFRVIDGVTTVTALGGAAPAHIKVGFRPVDQNGNFGWLSMKTNDPAHPELKIELKGYGAPPQCEILTANFCPGMYEGCCDYKVLPGTEDPKTHEKYNPCTGRFTIKNKNGSSRLTVTDVKLRNGLGMFNIAAKPNAGTPIDGGKDLADAITVDYAPTAEFKSDFLDVQTSLGNCSLELRGGSPPVIDTDPQGILDFGELLPAGIKQFAVLTVKNVPTWNKQLPLVVSKLDILNGAGQPDLQFYKVLDTGCTDQIDDASRFVTSSPIPVDESRKICLQLDPTGGSLFIDTFKLTSNDPNYADGFNVTLSGTTECALPPVAVLTVKGDGIGGDEPVSCATSSSCTGTGEVCLDGVCQKKDDGNLSVTIKHEDGDTFVFSGGESYDLMPNPNDRKVCDVQDKTKIVEYHWTIPAASEQLIEMSSVANLNQKELSLKLIHSGSLELRLRVVAEDGSTNLSVASQRKFIQVNYKP